MEHDQEMTEVFEEEPQAMDTSDGPAIHKPVLATMSDEITQNKREWSFSLAQNISAIISDQVEVLFPSIIEKVMDAIFSAINANLTERFSSATRPKQPDVMGHLIGMMERAISSLLWQSNMQRQHAMFEEIRGILVQQMMQLVKPTVDQIMNDIFPAMEL